MYAITVLCEERVLCVYIEKKRKRNNVYKLAFWWELSPQEQGKNEGNSEFAYCSRPTQHWKNATNQSECGK